MSCFFTVLGYLSQYGLFSCGYNLYVLFTASDNIFKVFFNFFFFFSYNKLDEDDFKEEQNSVARLIHMLHNDDPEEMLKVSHNLILVFCSCLLFILWINLFDFYIQVILEIVFCFMK